MNGESLRELMAGPLRVEEYKLTIAEIFQGGQWNWDRISYDLPREIKEKICAIPMQLWGDKEDTLMWKFTRDKEFSTTSTYALLNPRILKTRPLKDIRFGSLTFDQKLLPSSSCASMTVFLSNKSLLRKGLIVIPGALCVEMKMNQ